MKTITSKMQWGLVVIIALLNLSACGDGGGDNDGDNAGANQDDLVAEINQRFPYVADQPLDQLFICEVAGSSLIWYLDFLNNGNLQVYTTLDTGADLMQSGSYTHSNDTLNISINDVAISINESSIQIDTALGMISAFTSPNMQCYTYGHRYNTQEFTGVAHYSCPEANIQTASSDSNAIEFVHSAVSYSFPVFGSAFRQRDRYIRGSVNPVTRRGYGVYRRSGDDFYMFFDENQFDDVSYIKGRFSTGNSSITLDQTQVSASACTRD